MRCRWTMGLCEKRMASDVPRHSLFSRPWLFGVTPSWGVLTEDKVFKGQRRGAAIMIQHGDLHGGVASAAVCVVI